MKFSVGDKIVHPQHGPGQITGIVSRDLTEGAKSYYVVDIPAQGLTLHIPVLTVESAGMRAAMSHSRLVRVLSMLHGKPHSLPADHREREEQLRARVNTGRVMHLAGVVRDLTWLREQARLTAKDGDCLRKWRDLLASEMALVSGDTIVRASRLIDATLMAAVAGRSSASPSM